MWRKLLTLHLNSKIVMESHKTFNLKNVPFEKFQIHYFGTTCWDYKNNSVIAKIVDTI